jgi:large subunit ribosomal protein L10
VFKRVPTKKEKQLIVDELKEKFRNSKVAVLANYRGLDVATITRLRRRLRDSGSELKVAKNTLAKIAAREVGLQDLDAYLEGPTAIAFGLEDPSAPAKILIEFMRDYKQLEIKGGVLEGKAIQDKEIRKLADLPAREVLISKVLGGMQAPLYGLVNVLHGNVRNLVYVLEAIRKLRAGEAPG